MKLWYCTFLLLSLSCQSPHTPDKAPVSAPAIPSADKPPSGSGISGEQSWIGTIDTKIPVFIHYVADSSVVTGEITYLNTPDRRPIRLLGKMESDSSCRLLEFENDGNITGIITGTFSKEAFTGSWFSPKTRKDRTISLSIKDTLIMWGKQSDQTIDITGEYRYQYSKEGPTGLVTVQRLDQHNIAFSINAVTAPPAYNLADVPTDTVSITGDRFTYLIPGSDHCDFEVRFFNGFLTVDYLHGYCQGQFGHNASIDGIFLRVN